MTRRRARFVPAALAVLLLAGPALPAAARGIGASAAAPGGGQGLEAPALTTTEPFQFADTQAADPGEGIDLVEPPGSRLPGRPHAQLPHRRPAGQGRDAARSWACPPPRSATSGTSITTMPPRTKERCTGSRRRSTVGHTGGVKQYEVEHGVVYG